MLSCNRPMLLIWIVSLLLCCYTGVEADTYFPTDATINYEVFDYAIIGQDATGNNFSPTVNLILGGSVDGLLQSYNGSVVKMSGGSIDSGVITNDNSGFTMSGGSVNSLVYALNSSALKISGGTITDAVQVQDDTTLVMSGGNVSLDLMASGNSLVNLSGGRFGGDFFAFDSSTINFRGSNLTDQLNSVMDGYSDYTLSGKLLDGTSLNGKHLYVQTDTGASFQLLTAPIPEASSLVIIFLGLSGGGLYVFRPQRAGHLKSSVMK